MNPEDIALNIAKSLPEYFTDEAIKEMNNDFKNCTLLLAKDKNAFLCYKIKKNHVILKWMAVKKDSQSIGIGSLLIRNLVSIARSKNCLRIDVETLSPSEDYKPYEGVRRFYEKNGFKYIKIIPPKKSGWDEMVLYSLII